MQDPSKRSKLRRSRAQISRRLQTELTGQLIRCLIRLHIWMRRSWRVLSFRREQQLLSQLASWSLLQLASLQYACACNSLGIARVVLTLSRNCASADTNRLTLLLCSCTSRLLV